MDESTVRREAQKHADATVAGDLKTAGSSLTKEGAANAQAVMGTLPRELDSGQVTSVRSSGEDWTVDITYTGEGRDVSVRSRWAERDGTPKIVHLEVP